MAPKKPSKQQWEAFEERAKVAFVENPHGTRLLIKTSARPSGPRVTARVTTHRRTASELTHYTSVFETAPPASTSTALSRVVRLLRFAMQEVLGPMKAAQTTTLLSPRPLQAGDDGSAVQAKAQRATVTNENKQKKKKKKQKTAGVKGD
ncbi:hypothetical protein ATCC90586_010385 [Pythium insidiosum]|nr:hypothetical protein ATCC90586_010385 [Pythium insidiosum]